MKQTQKRPSRFLLVLAFFVAFFILPSYGNMPAQNLAQMPISLHFSDIEVTELLQILATLGASNFLLSDSIKGKISVSLNNTPWQTALHSILASRGLRIIRNGDIYWIGPHAEIQAFQKFRPIIDFILQENTTQLNGPICNLFSTKFSRIMISHSHLAISVLSSKGEFLMRSYKMTGLSSNTVFHIVKISAI